MESTTTSSTSNDNPRRRGEGGRDSGGYLAKREAGAESGCKGGTMGRGTKVGTSKAGRRLEGLLDPGDDGVGVLRGRSLSAQISGDGLAVGDGLE
jgi:hypothetical protein